jgi:hypothetical protein
MSVRECVRAYDKDIHICSGACVHTSVCIYTRRRVWRVWTRHPDFAFAGLTALEARGYPSKSERARRERARERERERLRETEKRERERGRQGENARGREGA